MQTITFRSRVGTDGVLHLDIPSNYAEAALDVTVRSVDVPVMTNGSTILVAFASEPPG